MRPILPGDKLVEIDSEEDDILFSSSIASKSHSAKPKRNSKLPFQPLSSQTVNSPLNSSSRIGMKTNSEAMFDC
jgi:hypothetical protein